MQEISIKEYMKVSRSSNDTSQVEEIDEEEKFEKLKEKVARLTKQLDLSIALGRKKQEELVLSSRRINALEEEIRNLRKNKQ